MIKELREKVATYQCRTNLGFFDMEPLVEEVHALREQLRAAKAEVAKWKEIAEPLPIYFKKNGVFTLEVDLCVCEALTKANVSRNQVPLLFIIFARFFRVRIPSHWIKVPYKYGFYI